MSVDDLKESIKFLYNTLFYNVYGLHYNFTLRGKNLHYIKEFREEYGDVPQSFLVDYFCHCFNRRSRKEGKRITAMFVIGKFGRDNFNTKYPNYQFYYRKDLLTPMGLSTDDLLSDLSDHLSKDNCNPEYFDLSLDNSEEIYKGKYDDEYQLVYCSEFTTLFHPKSEHCQRCKFSEECKKILKANYFNLYHKRGLK